jgi:hypothetical protein
MSVRDGPVHPAARSSGAAGSRSAVLPGGHRDACHEHPLGKLPSHGTLDLIFVSPSPSPGRRLAVFGTLGSVP